MYQFGKLCLGISTFLEVKIYAIINGLSNPSLSRDLNTGPADYKSAALPTKPLRRHTKLSLVGKKGGALEHKDHTEFTGFSHGSIPVRHRTGSL